MVPTSHHVEGQVKIYRKNPSGRRVTLAILQPGEVFGGLNTYPAYEQEAEMMGKLQDMGCHNINLVTPTHVVPQILAALPDAIAMGLSLPLVYNTGGYDRVETLRLLDGVIDIYMFQAGSTSYAIATVGCNMRCAFCQNWEISQLPKGRPPPRQAAAPDAPEPICPPIEAAAPVIIGEPIAPQQIVDAARHSGAPIDGVEMDGAHAGEQRFPPRP